MEKTELLPNPALTKSISETNGVGEFILIFKN